MPQDNAARAGLSAFEVVLLGRLRSLAFRAGDRELAAARNAMRELGVADLAARPVRELAPVNRFVTFVITS